MKTRMIFGIHLLIVILILFPSIQALATVSYYAVNKITNEWTVLETGGFLGRPIAWESVGEKTEAQMEQHAKQMGYRFTDFPYKIETCIFFLILLFILMTLFSTLNNKSKKLTRYITMTRKRD